jgi:hypothetical protein
MKKKLNPNSSVSFINMGSYPEQVCLIYDMTYREVVDCLKKIPNCKAHLKSIKSMGKKQFKKHKFYAMEDKIKGEEVYFIVFNEKFKFKDTSYAIIAHEILHVIQFYLPKVLDRNVEIEAEAYLHTYLMNKCTGIFRGSN